MAARRVTTNQVISSASLAFMFALWYLKRRAAVVLDSATLEMDAACSLACIGAEKCGHCEPRLETCRPRTEPCVLSETRR
jgi:hypothetical protein